MIKYFNKFWFTFTAILCTVFVVLFFPMTIEKVGIGKAIIYTIIGLVVIWIVYFVRAYIFTQIFSDNTNSDKE